jgi:aminopeptidase-like protein
MSLAGMTRYTKQEGAGLGLARPEFAQREPAEIGQDLYRLIAELYPICRSITGDGLRQTLALLQQHLPLELHEVPSGTQVFDWTVPKEWNIRDAYVKNSAGERIIDFRQSNLHVVNYSVPVRATMSLAELEPHLFSLPEYPGWIPYRTSYYKETWGFCLSHRQLQEWKASDHNGLYEVCIDSTLESGHLTYGECYLEGRRTDEILISCHACHPSLCNDNLSGVAVCTYLARHLQSVAREYSYRFLFIPGTIGAITWLALNRSQAQKIKHGLVVACVGDPGRPTYKKSRQGNAEIDRAVEHVLRHSGEDYAVLEFSPYGYDERQYCSPGFNLPVGNFSRTPWGRFPEYHTSADNLDLVRPAALADSLHKFLAIVSVLEKNQRYTNQNPYGEPQLGKRGLYTAIGNHADSKSRELAMFWVLNLSDGEHSLLDIAERSGIDFATIEFTAGTLHEHGLLKRT